MVCPPDRLRRLPDRAWRKRVATVTYIHNGTIWLSDFFGTLGQWEQYQDEWVRPMGWRVIDIMWRENHGPA